MINCIGIRKETKDKTEFRAPFSPDQVRALTREHGMQVIVEPWEDRIFPDGTYQAAGAMLSSDLRDCNIIFGIKEIAPQYLLDNAAYAFFSHTIKAQPYNMPMLRNFLDKHCTLLDYELVKDDAGRRLVFFGNFAGNAGMIDSLWALGRRLRWEGIPNPFEELKYANQYAGLDEAEGVIQQIGDRIRTDGLPPELVPFICAFTGYGNVSKGAQQIFDFLPTVAIKPSQLHDFFAAGKFSDTALYKVEFYESDLYQPLNADCPFDLDEFYSFPERYDCSFHKFLPYFTVLMNGIYWESKYPRLISKQQMKKKYSNGSQMKLRVIGDISCDPEGSIEATVKSTTSANPVFVFEPLSEAIRDGWEGDGPVILAVDKLPAELPREASIAFGRSLMPFMPALAASDFTLPLSALQVGRELQRSIIAHQGKLAPQFERLSQFLI